MTRINSTLLILMLFHAAQAQIDQVVLGPGYGKAVFYTLEDGPVASFTHADWDIAFSVDPQDFGVLVNEGSTAELPPVELYLSNSTDFATADTIGMQQVHNDEVSWDAGAFNQVSTSGDPFDLGWGSYNPGNNSVIGSRVFIIKLRDTTYKKLLIESLAGRVYTFRHADLDGANEVIQTVEKDDFAGRTLAYYRFASNEVLDLEPERWDLLFTRYFTTLDAEGVAVQYPVTGVLLNSGVKAARIEGVDPLDYTYEDYQGDYSDTLSVIGHDWKNFNLTTFQWEVPMDRVYLVQTPTDSIWKVQLIDFEGASTGVATLEKDFQTALVSSANELPPFVPVFKLFPNPTVDFVQLELHLQSDPRGPAFLSIISTAGQQLTRRPLPLHTGVNRIEVPLDDLAAGMYFLSVRIGSEQIVRRISINP